MTFLTAIYKHSHTLTDTQSLRELHSLHICC